MSIDFECVAGSPLSYSQSLRYVCRKLHIGQAKVTVVRCKYVSQSRTGF